MRNDRKKLETYLGYYGYKLIDILEFLTNITGRKRDWKRLRKLKFLRTVLVGLSIYRVLL